MSQSVQIPILRIESIIKSVWAKLRKFHIFGIIFGVIGFLLLLFSLIFMLEVSLWMTPAIKSTFLAISLVLAAVLGWILSRRFIGPSYQQILSDFTLKFDLEPLRNLLDLSHTQDDQKTSMHQAAIEQNLGQLHEDEIYEKATKYTKSHPLNDLFQITSIILVSGIVIFGIMATFQPNAVLRILAFNTTFEPENPFLYTITPGNLVLEQGSGTTIKITFEDESPESSILEIRTDSEDNFRQIRMNSDNLGVFTAQIPSLFDDHHYQIRMDSYRSPRFKIDVQLLPRFFSLKIRASFPSHTNLDDVIYEYPFTRIEAYPGSVLFLEGQSNQALQSLVLHEKQDSVRNELNLNEENNRFEYEYPVTENDSLWFTMTDVNGLQNRNTFNFNIVTLEDEFPLVRLIDPETDLDILEPSQLGIIYQLNDDFGFNSVKLMYEIERSYGTNRSHSGSVKLPTPSERTSTKDLNWDLAEYGLFPMDKIRFWVEAADNDAPGGFKTSRSATITVEISSMTDHLLAQEEKEEDLLEQMQEFTETYEQNQRDLENLRQQIMQDASNNIEQAQETEAIKEQREKLSEQIQKIQEQFEELTEEVKTGSQMSDETKKMYEDLQQLMKEIDDPEILKALEELQKGLENLDQNQVRDALQNMKFNEDRFKERLNRTMELFKSLQMNAELDRMSSILEDLAQREDALIGEELPDINEQSDRQSQIQQDLNSLNERLDRLAEKSPTKAQNQIESLKNDTQRDIQDVDEKLTQDIQAMSEDSAEDDSESKEADQQSDEQQSGDQQSGGEEQSGDQQSGEQQSGEQQSGGVGASEESSPQQRRREEIRDQLQEMQKRMQETKAVMSQKQIQVNMQALLGIMQYLLLLSDAQEDIVEQVSEVVQGSSGFIEIARNQRNITSSFSQITDSLYRVSTEIPSFPNRVNTRKAEVLKNLESSITLMAERDRNRSISESRIAMGGINEIASLLADLLEQLDNSQGDGSGSGGMSAEQMMEQLQKMSGDQQQLNQQMQDMINDLQGERLMQGQMDRLDQMARQQNAIRRQLQELQQRGGLESGDQLLSELQRLGEQMEEAINALRGGSVDRTLINRQQNILSRMLQAERAFNEREQDEERRGLEPDDIDRVSPTELTLESLREQIRRGLQDSNETRFSEEYQQLIQKYFELLEEFERRRPALNR